MQQDQFYYEGFSGPNGTIVPDDVFDVLAPRLKESELRVLLYVIRRTFGFGKNADAISLRQLTDGICTRQGTVLDIGTGMSRKAVIAGIKGLIEKGVITVHKSKSHRGDRQVNVYRLRFRNGKDAPVTESNYPGDPDTPPPVTESNHRGEPDTPPAVTPGNPQESVIQESDSQDTDEHNNKGVVASSVSDKQLYDDLRAMDVHHNTAARLLRDYPPTQVREMLQYLIYRLQGGWRPKESPAAWLISALRDDYAIPQYQRTGNAAEEGMSPARLAAESARRTADLERRLEIERRGLLEQYEVEQHVEQMWQAVRRRLRQQNQGSPMLAAAVLRMSQPGRAELFVPRPMLERIKAQASVIQAAIEAELGSSARLAVKAL